MHMSKKYSFMKSDYAFISSPFAQIQQNKTTMQQNKIQQKYNLSIIIQFTIIQYLRNLSSEENIIFKFWMKTKLWAMK